MGRGGARERAKLSSQAGVQLSGLCDDEEMKRLMRYKIKAGRVTEVRDVLMDVELDPTTKRPRPRGKRRGKALAQQIERNMREAVRRLARILNSNFRGGDLFLTLKYNDERLPESKEAAKRELRNFIRRLDRAYRKQTGKKLRWVAVTADRSSKTGDPVRLHHHLVLDPLAWELIAKHWPADQFSYRRLDGTGDYTAVALYMVKNAGYERQVRTWSTSKDLEKPIFTAPKLVTGSRVMVPKGARIVERVEREDLETGFHSGYLRYIEPEEPAGKREFPDTTTQAHARATLIGNSKPGDPGGGGPG